jgi:hypothetical protein
MPDTGAPWNLRFPAPSDLVRDAPVAFENLADDVAAGLSAAGGLVAVKIATKTDQQASSSIASGEGVAASGLSIAHAVADDAHKVYLFAVVHARAGTGDQGNVGLRIKAGSTGLTMGTTAGSRTALTAFSTLFASSSGPPIGYVAMQANVFAAATHTPGSTASVTYTVDVHNMLDTSQTVHINRSNERLRQHVAGAPVVVAVAA